MTDRDPRLDPFEALIGTWETEATHPLVDAEDGFDAVHQRAATPGEWWNDLKVVYRRRD